MIIITSPTAIANEISLIHSLFKEGMTLLHIRKPDFSEEEINTFVTEIRLEYRNRLVLHSHHNLSTSTHSIEDFNELDPAFDYAFISPVFTSISKENYHPKTDLFEQIKKRTNHKTQLIALSGISADNIRQTLISGFDDVALLGIIWKSSNPIENFKSCLQIALS
jgi:thiamine-phosphate pyrophosphorylase